MEEGNQAELCSATNQLPEAFSADFAPS